MEAAYPSSTLGHSRSTCLGADVNITAIKNGILIQGTELEIIRSALTFKLNRLMADRDSNVTMPLPLVILINDEIDDIKKILNNILNNI